MPKAWKADPVHCSKEQSLGLTWVQMMGGSLARHLDGEGQRLWRDRSRAGTGDISKKEHLVSNLRPELQNGRLGHWALQSELP